MPTPEQVNAALNWPEWDLNSAILRDLSAWLTPQVAEHCEWSADEYAEEQHPETIVARQVRVLDRVITPQVVAAAVQYARYLTVQRPYPCTRDEAARYAADAVAQIIADQCGVYWPARNALLAAVAPLVDSEEAWQREAEMTGPRPSSHGVMAGPTEPCPGVLYRFEISFDGGAKYVHCGEIDGEVVARITVQPITSHQVIRRFIAQPEWEDDRG